MHSNPMILARSQPAFVASVATAFPDHTVDQGRTIEVLQRLFPAEDPGRVESLVRRSGVQRRFLVEPPETVLAASDFTGRNRRYHAAALELSARAAEVALERAGIEPGEVDAIVDVSCTGIAIPALDVGLVPRLGLRHDLRRFPITESGCAAGALALGLAGSLARTGQTVLVTAVELCSLTLCPGDRSRTNLVASVLFGDGAAAALVRPEGPGPRLLASGSRLIPDSAGVMGFDVGSHGLRIVLERELPGIVAERLPPAVADFMRVCGTTPEHLGLHLVHPGGRKILEAYEQRFGLAPGALIHSRRVLSDSGNLSSASILAVLEQAWATGERVRADQLALLLAIGPGLSLELSLLDWSEVEPWPAPSRGAR